jgi:hypothetical protein
LQFAFCNFFEMFITSGIEAVMNAFDGGDPATTE